MFEKTPRCVRGLDPMYGERGGYRLAGHDEVPLDFSVTAGERYVLNHCDKCGAKLGDHFMHGEPDGPFFGEATEGLQVRMVNEQIALDCGYSEGGLGLWLKDQFEREDPTK